MSIRKQIGGDILQVPPPEKMLGGQAAVYYNGSIKEKGVRL